MFFFEMLKLFWIEFSIEGFWLFPFDHLVVYDGYRLCFLFVFFVCIILNSLCLPIFYCVKLYFLLLILFLLILSKICSEIFDLFSFIFTSVKDIILSVKIRRRMIHSFISVCDHFLTMFWQYPFLSFCYILGYFISHYVITIFSSYFNTLISILSFLMLFSFAWKSHQNDWQKDYFFEDRVRSFTDMIEAGPTFFSK